MDWRGFLARPPLPQPSPQFLDAAVRQPILVTGAGGSIGSALRAALAQLRALVPGFRPSQAVFALAAMGAQRVCA